MQRSFYTMRQTLAWCWRGLALGFRRYPRGVICPETRIMEFLSAAYATWWSILLCLPVHLFESNRQFLGLSHMAHSIYWAVGTAVVALFQWTGWFTNNPLTRWVGFLFGASVWTFVDVGIYIGAVKWHILPVNTGFGVYHVAAMLDFYCAVFCLPSHVYSYIFPTWYKHKMEAQSATLGHVVLVDTEGPPL